MPILHSQTTGNGPDLFMVHGWAMHSGIFSGLVEPLSAHYRVTLVDLPGHGDSPPLASENGIDSVLHSWTQALLEAAPEQASWLGWSLGGRLASHIANTQPQRVQSLILIASNPQFVQSDNWPHGMSEANFNAFAESIESDYEKTLKRFLSLQVRGSTHSREDLRQLRDTVMSHGRPHMESLRQGLLLLRELRVVSALNNIQCPTLSIFGERDTLVPSSVIDVVNKHIPQGQASVLPGAGHAPFLSDSDAVIRLISNFLS